MIFKILQIFLVVGVPYLAIAFSRNSKIGAAISPIVVCFAVGILVCNFGLMPIDESISQNLMNISILLGLPLLLYSADVIDAAKNAKGVILSFACCLVAGVIASILVAVYFQDRIEEIWKPAGMIVGIFTGGTANLFAVGLALEAEDAVFTLLNTSEVFWGAIYLLFLLSAGQRVFHLILPRFKNLAKSDEALDEYYGEIVWPDVLQAIGYTIVLVGLSVGASFLVFGKMQSNFIIVSITGLAIASSFNHKVKNWKGAFEVGDYCLLMFGVAVGLISDFYTLVSDGGEYILFVMSVLLILVFLHLFLARLFRIDADTFIVTAAAALFSPVFIGQITSALKNKSLLVGGIAAALLGLASGNFIGIGVAYIVKYLTN